MFGRAGLFTGTNYVTIDSSASLHALSAFSVVAWIRPTLLDGARAPGIVSKRSDYGDQTEFAVFLWTENRLFVDIDGETDRISSRTTFDTNTWYHVAVVFDGTLAADKRVNVYVNGQLDSTHYETSTTVTQFDSPLEVGRLRNGGDGFIGSIDEVALWQRALGPGEILTVFQSASPLR